MAEKYVAIMLNNESFQVANDNCALRRLNRFECLASNMVLSPVRLPRGDLEEHVVLQDVHIGASGDAGGHAFWKETWNGYGEAAARVLFEATAVRWPVLRGVSNVDAVAQGSEAALRGEHT